MKPNMRKKDRLSSLLYTAGGNLSLVLGLKLFLEENGEIAVVRRDGSRLSESEERALRKTDWYDDESDKLMDEFRDAMEAETDAFVSLYKKAVKVSAAGEIEPEETVEARIGEWVSGLELPVEFDVEYEYDESNGSVMMDPEEGNTDIAFYAPPGTNMFVDAMCVLKSSDMKAEAEAYINFLCGTEAALANTEYIGYSTPQTEARKLLDPELAEDPMYYPDAAFLKTTEVFLTLPDKTNKLMNELWIKLKIH